VAGLEINVMPGRAWHCASLYRARQCESFNGKLCDECLNREIFYSLEEAEVVIEQWRDQ
jgi:hypothetical protein